MTPERSDELFQVRVGASGASQDAPGAWADGMVVTLPRQILRVLSDHLADDGTLQLPDEPLELPKGATDLLRLTAAFTEQRPTSTRLPISYQRVPAPVRTVIARAAGRWGARRMGRADSFPRWPLDLSADFLADIGGARSTFRDGPAPVLLTHDLDTLEGLHNLLTGFLPLEEGVGARSANYIVPCAWELDHGALREVSQRGHEIGTHGYDHANRTAYLPTYEREARLDEARRVLESYDVRGYRAPSLVRTRALLTSLVPRYAYDTSIPTSGGPFPVPDTGCVTGRPFTVLGILEIPLTMPRDGSLQFLGHSPEDILDLWRRCAEQLAVSGGIVCLLTHCERRFSGNAPMLEVYARFLDWLAGDDRFTFTLPRDLTAQLRPAP